LLRAGFGGDGGAGEHREFTQADIINGYRLCNALPNIHFVMSIGIPSDEPDWVHFNLGASRLSVVIASRRRSNLLPGWGLLRRKNRSSQ